MKPILKELETGVVTTQTMNDKGIVEIEVTDRVSYVTIALNKMFANFYQLN